MKNINRLNNDNKNKINIFKICPPTCVRDRDGDPDCIVGVVDSDVM